MLFKASTSRFDEIDVRGQMHMVFGIQFHPQKHDSDSDTNIYPMLSQWIYETLFLTYGTEHREEKCRKIVNFACKLAQFMYRNDW